MPFRAGSWCERVINETVAWRFATCGPNCSPSRAEGQWQRALTPAAIVAAPIEATVGYGATRVLPVAHSTRMSSRRIVATNRVTEKKMATAVSP